MILKNFKLKKGDSLQEFPGVKILQSEYVFTDVPICEIDLEDEESDDLYLIDLNQMRGIAKVVSKSKIQDILVKTKIFNLKSIASAEPNAPAKLIEVPKEEAEISLRLPIETPIDMLFVMNGEVLMLDNQGEIAEGENK